MGHSYRMREMGRLRSSAKPESLFDQQCPGRGVGSSVDQDQRAQNPRFAKS
jgi:hypothetical protein